MSVTMVKFQTLWLKECFDLPLFCKWHPLPPKKVKNINMSTYKYYENIADAFIEIIWRGEGLPGGRI